VVLAATFAATLGLALGLAPAPAAAQNLFDFFFNGGQKQQQQGRQAAPQQQPQQQNGFFDLFNNNQQQQQAAPPSTPRVAGSGPAFCVRSCDGRYFPLTLRGNATPVALCQAFCPATATKVFFGSTIDGASSSTGERYADSENAFAYRKALRDDCTCNGRDPAGLAPVDLTLDNSLRAGDVVATSDGLVAYTGVRVGNGQSADFTPVASYPGLTADVRARLGEMKVAPVSAETANEAPPPAISNEAPAVQPTPEAPKTPAAKPARRAEVN
jgi:hypothetical protein